MLFLDKRQWRRLDAGLHVEPDQHDTSRGSCQAPSAPRRLCLHRHHHRHIAVRPHHLQPTSNLASLLQAATDHINTYTEMKQSCEGGNVYVSVLVWNILPTGEKTVNFSLCSLCGEVKGQCLLIWGYYRRTNALSSPVGGQFLWVNEWMSEWVSEGVSEWECNV